MPINKLTQPLSHLVGVGPSVEKKLALLGLYKIEDILFYFPIRYQNKTQITPIAAAVAGEAALFKGVILASSITQHQRRNLRVKLEDQTGVLDIRFYHFHLAQAKQLKPGLSLSVFGEVRGSSRAMQIIHPEYRIGNECGLLEDNLTAVYPVIKGIGQALWRKLIAQALKTLETDKPPNLLRKTTTNSRLSLPDAISLLHRPPVGTDLEAIMTGDHPAQARLALEELTAHQISMSNIRREAQACCAPRISSFNLKERLQKKLPFSLTSAQRRVLEEIGNDLSKPYPMLRLIQGDVGSGKTLIAALTAAQVVDAGWQVALMAPTEILAEQHRNTFNNWFKPLGIEVELLTSRLKGKKRKAILERVLNRKILIVIGTHALFQEDVVFNQLGLTIVDEQHRFGVVQRLRLTRKTKRGYRPHQLTMTATPIPRTLSMVAYADLDSSIIDELPPGRKPIKTVLIENTRRAEVIARVGDACKIGRQAYWVCTLIEESQALEAEAAECTAKALRQALPDQRVGLVHGKLSAAEKKEVMIKFADGTLQILVSTTVIEVGVDVSNASMIIIENPERLGLAQLHQLRGRVGRGSANSFCLLLYNSPLSAVAQHRLSVLRETNDGFRIAEHDLTIRGPGEVLGTKQTGLATFRVARLPKHEFLIKEAHMHASALLNNAQDKADQLVKRWTSDQLDFSQV